MSESDNSFFNTLVIVLVTLTVFMFASITIARAVTTDSSAALANDPMYQAAVLERIKPVGRVRTSSAADEKQTAASSTSSKENSANSTNAAVSGDKVYKSACFACHGTGAAGAPKLGDKAAWKSRIAQGMDTLVSHALNGFKGMPAKGGRADLSDNAIKTAIQYMVDSSK